MIEVYAFLRGRAEEVEKFFRGQQADVEKQTLREHVDKALKALDEIKNGRIWKFTVKLFGDEDLVEEDLKTIILFHDIGKMFYQANVFPDRKRGVKYLSFRGHEYFSTFLADRYLFENYMDDRPLILSTILYHHHAMGLKERGRVREIRVCRSEDEYEAICEIVGNMLKSYGLKVNEFLQYLRRFKPKSKNGVLVFSRAEDVYEEVDGINRKIWDLFVRDKAFRRKMLTFTVILQICDYKGSEGRTKKPPKFYDILREFAELYGSSR